MTGRRLLSKHVAGGLMIALGAGLHSEGLRDPPRQMATAYAKPLTPEPLGVMRSPNDESHQTAGRTG